MTFPVSSQDARELEPATTASPAGPYVSGWCCLGCGTRGAQLHRTGAVATCESCGAGPLVRVRIPDRSTA